MKNRRERVIGLVIVIFIILLVVFRNEFEFLTDHQSFQDFISGFGALAPIMIILIIIAEVIFAPIPGFISIISAGFIFGPLEGGFYAYIGNMIGTIIAFYFSRKYGKELAKRLIHSKSLEKYEQAIGKSENFFLLFYFLPILPTDILSFAFGLSNINQKKFLITISFGFLFYIAILSYFGNYLSMLFF